MKKLILVLAALGSGCFSLFSQHSARVMEPGRFETLAGLTFFIPEGQLLPEGGALPALDAQLGILPRVQIGVRTDLLSLALEARMQVLKGEEGRADLCLEVGAAGILDEEMSGLYGGLCISRHKGNRAPYLHVRGMKAWIQAFVGVEIDLRPALLLVPELAWMQMTATGDSGFAFNLGLRFRARPRGEEEPPSLEDEVAPVAPSE